MSNSRQPRKILIVDDEPDVVSYLEMLLRDAGYDTVSAANGAKGLELVQQERPDLVTLDISMPEASGTRLYREIKTDAELESVPVIIITAVTGYAGDKYGYEKFLSQSKLVPPPAGYFPKPIDRDELLAKVDELLA
jgi:CheY-like chemotaxis protein